MKNLFILIVAFILLTGSGISYGATMKTQKDTEAVYETLDRQVTNLNRILARWDLTVNETLFPLEQIVLYDIDEPIAMSEHGIATFHVEIRIGSELAQMLSSQLKPIIVAAKEYLELQRDAMVMP